MLLLKILFLLWKKGKICEQSVFRVCNLNIFFRGRERHLQKGMDNEISETDIKN